MMKYFNGSYLIQIIKFFIHNSYASSLLSSIFFSFQASEFCEAHGLPVSDGTVHFNRTSFQEPESAIGAFRSLSIIEAKNDKSIGEVSQLLRKGNLGSLIT